MYPIRFGGWGRLTTNKPTERDSRRQWETFYDQKFPHWISFNHFFVSILLGRLKLSDAAASCKQFETRTFTTWFNISIFFLISYISPKSMCPVFVSYHYLSVIFLSVCPQSALKLLSGNSKNKKYYVLEY